MPDWAGASAPGHQKTVGPTAHKDFAIALLLPDRVGDVEHPDQAVHDLNADGQVKKTGL